MNEFDRCPICGEASGRGRYGFRTEECGSAECTEELERRKLRKKQRNLRPTNKGALEQDWKPGLPKGGR